MVIKLGELEYKFNPTLDSIHEMQDGELIVDEWGSVHVKHAGVAVCVACFYTCTVGDETVNGADSAKAFFDLLKNDEVSLLSEQLLAMTKSRGDVNDLYLAEKSKVVDLEDKLRKMHNENKDYLVEMELECERRVHELQVKIKELESQIEEQAADHFDTTEQIMFDQPVCDIAEETIAEMEECQVPNEITHKESIRRLEFAMEDNIRLLTENRKTHDENMFLRQTLHTMNILGRR